MNYDKVKTQKFLGCSIVVEIVVVVVYVVVFVVGVVHVVVDPRKLPLKAG